MSKEVIQDMERELAELRRSLAADTPVHGAHAADLSAEIRAAQRQWADDLDTQTCGY
jgi:hypothetical protein